MDRSGCLLKRRHDFLGEQLHRAQNLFLREIAESEARVEMVDAHLVLDLPDLRDAGLRRTHDEIAVGQLYLGRLVLEGTAVARALSIRCRPE